MTPKQRCLDAVERLGISTRFQGVLLAAVTALGLVAVVVGWLDSIVFISAVTILTWIDGRWNAWIAARIAKHQTEDADVAEVKELIEEKL